MNFNDEEIRNLHFTTVGSISSAWFPKTAPDYAVGRFLVRRDDSMLLCKNLFYCTKVDNHGIVAKNVGSLTPSGFWMFTHTLPINIGKGSIGILTMAEAKRIINGEVRLES